MALEAGHGLVRREALRRIRIVPAVRVCTFVTYLVCGAQLGDYKCTAPFGVITDCNSPDFNGVDGILGFGLPKAGQEGRELPTPLLFAMTDQENKMSNARDLTRKFSFFSTDTDGASLAAPASSGSECVPGKRSNVWHGAARCFGLGQAVAARSKQ